MWQQAPRASPLAGRPACGRFFPPPARLARRAQFVVVAPPRGAPPSLPLGRRPSQATVAAAAAAAAAAPGEQHEAHAQQQHSQPSPAAATAAAGPGLPPAATALALDCLRPDWWLLLLAAAVMAGTVVFSLLFPLAIGDVFDVCRQQGALAGQSGAAAPAGFLGLGSAGTTLTFRRAIINLSACLLLSAAGNAGVTYLAPVIGERFGTRLKTRLMQDLVARKPRFFDSATSGDLVARLTLDVGVLQTTLADFLGQRGFRSLFEVLGALAIIAAKEPLLVLIVCAITPLLSRLLRTIAVRSAALSYQRQAVAAEALAFASERLAHVQTVQVFAAEEREAAAFEAASRRGLALAEKYAVFQGLVEGAGRLAINLGTISLLFAGGILVLQGRISVGTLLAINVFNLFISIGLSSVAASVGELGKALGALERVADLVLPPQEQAQQQQEPGSSSSSSSEVHATGLTAHGAAAAAGNVYDPAPAASVSGRVEFRGVWFKYAAQPDWALRGVNLTLQPGRTLALVGPSGGGKSTIAALLLGLYTPQQGAVLLDGRPLEEVGVEEARRHMAAVLQQPMLMSGSVADQIRYGRPEASNAEIRAAAAAANAEEFIAELPQGYDTPVGERGHALSGGQKQRLAIARALLRQPEVLVLDEATSALDVESEATVRDALERPGGPAKLVIAHRLTTVQRADSIAVVAGGRVVEQGTHFQLLGVAGGVYRRLVATAELGDGDWKTAADSEGEDGEAVAAEAPLAAQHDVAAVGAASS